MQTGYAIGRLTVIALSGQDRNKILNNLCTQDLRSLTPGAVAESFLLDVKGRTLSHGVLAALPEATWFVTAPGHGDKLAPHIDRYIIREDAAVAVASHDWDASLIPASSSLLPSLMAVVTEPASSADGHSRCRWSADGSVVAIHVPWLPEGATLVLVSYSTDASSNAFAMRLRTECVPSDTAARTGWEFERIEAFWPWAGIDCDERNLPQELAIDDRAISFKKGCYLGQETVARLDALGQVQKKLVPIRLERSVPIPLPCSVAVDGKEIAVITSLATSDAGETKGLAMVRRSHFAPGSVFSVEGTEAVVLERPSPIL
ncbi:MAG: YgfZ/GcvT domain-containing protein [Pirellula sp.]